VDIKVFILTVVENSRICKFNRIYLIEFENIKKSNEITLLAHTVAISFNIY
jgi:predicted small secreted protein